MGKIDYDKRKNKEIWLFCNSCQSKTLHTILTGVDCHCFFEHECGCEDGIDIWQDCDIIQCGGCKDITFTKKTWNSVETILKKDALLRQYPKINDHTQWYIKDEIHSIPKLLQGIYRETIQAINNKLCTLAGIGLRAIIETLCKDKNIKGGNLEKRIDNLVTDGYLTETGAEILHGIRLIGNDAAHDTKAPKLVQIEAAIKVVDHLILGIYIIPEKASNTLPKRTKNTQINSVIPKPGTTSAKK